MGKSHLPAGLLAFTLSMAAPTLSFAEEEPPSAEDKPSQKPLRHVEVHAPREAPDQEHLDREDLVRHRGTGNGDVLSQINGVQLNDTRNEGGAIDVGIRGLLGEGRVPVLIDGALQSTHTHRGYLGESDRTYIDMDLIRSVTVIKGSTFGAGGAGAIGGLVQMRTIEATDVVLPGKTWGILVKGSLYNNNRTPDVPTSATGQRYYELHNGQALGRINNGAASIALAGKAEEFDWLVAHSRRRGGNYFAGRHGVGRYADQMVVSPGQEVVNTSYESDSSLAKLGMNMHDAQRIEFVWRHHEQKAGEVLAAYWEKNSMDWRSGNPKPWPAGVQSMPQWALGTTRLDSYSGIYAYTPEDNKWIDLKLGIWKTGVTMDQFNGLWSGPPGSLFAYQFKHQYADARQGMNLSNRSQLLDGFWVFDYGFSLEKQRTEPINYVKYYAKGSSSARNAQRNEYSLWLNGEANTSFAVFKLGARTHSAVIDDYNTRERIRYQPRTDLLAEMQLPLAGGVGMYGKIGRAYRQPSLFESSASQQVFSYDANNPLRPEQSKSWELGLQGQWVDLLMPKGRLSARAGYFNNSVTDFISGANIPLTSEEKWPTIETFTNYDRFELQGWDLKLGYDAPAFFVEAAGMIYNEPRICSHRQAQQEAEEEEEPGPDCNTVGFRSSLVATRIPPRRSFNLRAGLRFLEGRMVMGSRLRYHSYKGNPVGWFDGTGAKPVTSIPSERIVDLFASLQLDRHFSVEFNVDNLQNRYAYDVGAVIKKPMPGRTVRLSLTGRF